MTKDQIADTLTQWAYDNLPLGIAPTIMIQESHDIAWRKEEQRRTIEALP